MTIQQTGRKITWKQDPETVKAEILRVATKEFADQGLSGARIDEIAAKTSFSKRMIYYYFGDKEGLYLHVLEAAYGRMRAGENAPGLEALDPVEALRQLVGLTFDAHLSEPDFIRLVMIENIHHARYLKTSKVIPDLNRPIIDKLRNVCDRGKAAGVFYPDADPLELHWMISALSFYNVSNRHSFGTSFGGSLHTPEGQARLRHRAVEAVMAATVIGHKHVAAGA